MTAAHTRRITRLLALSSGLILLLFATRGCWLHLSPYHGYTPEPFSPEAWAAADPDRRGRMTDDLLNRYGLIGRTRPEVLALLGRDGTESGGGVGGTLVYRVGYRGSNPNFPMVLSYFLLIEFDASGRVLRAFVVD
jgi:hypothetical protein